MVAVVVVDVAVVIVIIVFVRIVDALVIVLVAYVGPAPVILEPSWSHGGPILEPCLGQLGPSWSHVALRSSHVGPSWDHLGPILCYLGAMWGLCWAILVLILGQRGTPPQFFSDLCCFFGGAKNTVNYEVFRGADHSRRQGAAAVWLKLWPSAGGVAGRQALLARFKELTPNSGPAGQKVQGGISSISIIIIISSISLNNSSSSSPPSSSSSSSSSP